ncbi:IS3 family transposase [Rathayibacter agropyri]|uniref:IS3 family transposase n=1 Tax=Rathayibacter agropyri TaxID=1634927 RepID=UPI0015679A60|nr:transposase [Rathayibacter agropyri]
MGRTGICYDNAAAEAFFASYKKELMHTKPWPTLEFLRTETFLWIETYYNTRRRRSTIGYLRPTEHELGFRNIEAYAKFSLIATNALVGGSFVEHARVFCISFRFVPFAIGFFESLGPSRSAPTAFHFAP